VEEAEPFSKQQGVAGLPASGLALFTSTDAMLNGILRRRLCEAVRATRPPKEGIVVAEGARCRQAARLPAVRRVAVDLRSGTTSCFSPTRIARWSPFAGGVHQGP